MRSKAQYDEVLRLVEEDLSDSAISRMTGIPRTTIRDWRRGFGSIANRQSDGCGADHDFASMSAADYVYLLGLYLGDGYIAKSQRVWKLRITLDKRYPMIIEECAASMEALMPGQRAHIYQRKRGCVEVSMYSKHWPCLFPQHGKGRKHERRILLEAWQEELIESAQERLVRGLIHSDGCRVETLDRGVPSVRYHFKNLSEDIKAIYCRSLDALGIAWTRPCDEQIAIYTQADVRELDRYVGPKC